MEIESLHPHKRKRKKILIVLLSVLAVLVVVRIFLPYIVLRYVNNTLANLEEYRGHVEDIDIALIRGAYVIRDIKLDKIQKAENKVQDSIHFFSSTEVDLSVEWKALFKGSLVGEIYVENSVLNFVKEAHKGEDVKADTADFRKLIKDLMPLTVNRFEITNGEIHYIDTYANPQIDVPMNDINVVATNLSNANDSAKLLPAHLDASGNLYEGNFKMQVDFDALNKLPTFDLNAELNNMNLVLFNNFLRAYGNFDVRKGRFGLYTEFAAKEGSFGGYVKPVVKEIEVFEWQQDKGENLGHMVWEAIVGTVAKLLENPKAEQVATKIPIQGKFEKPDVNLWRAISYVLRNAFVYALKPSIDRSINIRKLEEEDEKTFLEKVLGKNKEQE